MRKASAIELDDAQREKLMKLAHSNSTEVRLARRASIVLLAADGLDNHSIGEILGVAALTVVATPPVMTTVPLSTGALPAQRPNPAFPAPRELPQHYT